MPPASAQPQTVERRRANLTEMEEWEKHKELLHELLKEKKMQWKDIITYMEENHNFLATFVKSQSTAL